MKKGSYLQFYHTFDKNEQNPGDMPRPRSDYRAWVLSRALLFPRTVPGWNHLPLHIRNASSIDRFKSSLMRDQDINNLLCKSHYYD